MSIMHTREEMYLKLNVLFCAAKKRAAGLSVFFVCVDLNVFLALEKPPDLPSKAVTVRL